MKNFTRKHDTAFARAVAHLLTPDRVAGFFLKTKLNLQRTADTI
jgi:hypothetical protein